MKLVLTLPERPGFLHAIPVLDLFLLLVLFFMVAPSLVVQSGVMVEPPPSKFQIEGMASDAIVVTLGAGQQMGNIHLGRRTVTFEELEQALERKRQDGSGAKSLVLLQTAADIPVLTERRVVEMVVGKGFRLALVGRGTGSLRGKGEEIEEASGPSRTR